MQPIVESVVQPVLDINSAEKTPVYTIELPQQIMEESSYSVNGFNINTVQKLEEKWDSQ